MADAMINESSGARAADRCLGGGASPSPPRLIPTCVSDSVAGSESLSSVGSPSADSATSLLLHCSRRRPVYGDSALLRYDHVPGPHQRLECGSSTVKSQATRVHNIRGGGLAQSQERHQDRFLRVRQLRTGTSGAIGAWLRN